jgi:hypothetical protein
MPISGERLSKLRRRKRLADVIPRRSLLALASAGLLAACGSAPRPTSGRPFPRSRRGNR